MASCDRKPVDLSLVMKEFNAWEEHTNRMTEENKNLERQVKFMKSEIEVGKERENYILSELEGLRKLVDVMQSTLVKRCDLEDENNKIKNDIEDLNEDIKSIKKVHSTEISQMETDMENLREGHKQMMEDLKSELKDQAQEEQNKLNKSLQEKNEQICHLKEQIIIQEQEKQQELMKLRLECDSKLQKLQKQNVKMQQTTSQMSTANQDIFRQKLQHVKRESEREVSSLKRTISELQGKLDAQVQRSHSSALSKRKRF